MSRENNPLSRKKNIVVQEVDGEVLIYDLERSKAFCLNQTSGLVWQACNGKRTISQINDLLGKQLNVQTDEDIVWFALDQLSKEKLIDPAVNVPSRFEGMSRREIIRKISVGSMIALPMVASLVAPTAIHAQSQLLPNGAVSGNAQTVVANCSSTVGFQALRNMACDNQTGAMCASMNAAQQPGGSCSNIPGGGATFSCVCVP